MKIQILDRTKKNKFVDELKEFGIEKVSELLIRSGNEKIRAYSGNLSIDEIMSIYHITPVEAVGLYVGKDVVDKSGVREVRPGIEGIYAWKSQITKRIIELDTGQEKEWFFGRNIKLNEKQIKEIGENKGFFAIKSEDSKDFIGVGKYNGIEPTLFCFLPKERRRKTSQI